MREHKFRITYQHEETGRITSRIITLGDKMPSFLGSRWRIIGEDQYTGLPDKNGKEIYEGDILRVANRPPFIIKDFSWLHASEWEESCYGYDFHGETDKEVEVIGNIYEHELLEPKA